MSSPTDPRQRILERVRTALGRPAGESSPEPERGVDLAGPVPRPVWSSSPEARFLERLERAAATWSEVGAPADIPAAVSTVLGDAQSPRLNVAGHPLLEDLSWPEGWRIGRGIEGAREADAAIVVAAAGIAETGSLVLPSGPQSPTSLNFLPDVHLVVLHRQDIVDYMEEAWTRLLDRASEPPRAVNVVTGPSRTADVEQTIQLGAHGPRRLHVLLL